MAIVRWFRRWLLEKDDAVELDEIATLRKNISPSPSLRTMLVTAVPMTWVMPVDVRLS